jgi:hypothetical protein
MHINVRDLFRPADYMPHGPMGAVTDPASIQVPPALLAQWQSECFAAYRADPMNRLMTDAIINKYCAQEVALKAISYQNAQAQGIMNAVQISATTLADQASQLVGQINLDLFGQILGTYSSYLTPGERDVLNGFFVEWRMTKTPDQVAQVTAIINKLTLAGAKLVPSAATQAAVDALRANLPNAGLPAATDASAPAFFYNQVLTSLHTIASSIPNAQAQNYLPSGGAMPGQVVSTGGSNALTAADWNQQQANQAVVTSMANSSYVSPLHTMFVVPTTIQATAAGIAPVAQSIQAAAPGNPILYLGLGLLAWKLLF